MNGVAEIKIKRVEKGMQIRVKTIRNLRAQVTIRWLDSDRIMSVCTRGHSRLAFDLVDFVRENPLASTLQIEADLFEFLKERKYFLGCAV